MLIRFRFFCCGMEQTVVKEVQSIVKFPKGELPVKYLVLPLLSTRLSHTGCLLLVEKVLSRIQGWRKNIFPVREGRS